MLRPLDAKSICGNLAESDKIGASKTEDKHDTCREDISQESREESC
jgi:hypothetical protein